MDNDNIMVSIICNAYNHERYIRDALEGFIMQKTSFKYEVLIHDDASTDSTASIIREYELKYPELIKPIYQTENQYSKHNGIIRKLQMERIQGKYVALCEGDDYWTDSEKLQKQFDFMEANPEYSMCATSSVWYNVLTGKDMNKGKVDKARDYTTEQLIESRERPFATATYFMVRDIVSRPDWKFPIGDYPTIIYASLLGKVHMLPDVTCVYRFCSEGSWTVRMDNEEKRAVISDRMVIGLENFNAYTEGKYEESVKKRILSQKYTAALLRHDFKALRSGELADIYNKKHFTKKISHFLHCKYPKAYRWFLGALHIKGHSN